MRRALLLIALLAAHASAAPPELAQRFSAQQVGEDQRIARARDVPRYLVDGAAGRSNPAHAHAARQRVLARPAMQHDQVNAAPCTRQRSAGVEHDALSAAANKAGNREMDFVRCRRPRDARLAIEDARLDGPGRARHQ